MHEIVQYDYHLLTVINRFEIKLGFGNKSVDEVCSLYNINPDFFVLIINLYCYKSFHPTRVEKILHYANSLNYLLKTNKYFIFVIMIALQEILNELKRNSTCTQVVLIQRYYDSILMELYNRNNYLERLQREWIVLDHQQVKETIENLGTMFHQNEITSCLDSIKNTLIRFYNGSNDEIATHALFLIFRFEKELEISYMTEQKTMSIYHNS